MAYNLFCDDYRLPKDCCGYVASFGIRPDTYINRDWVVVKNYEEFTKYIIKNGLPILASYDHDLNDVHYEINFYENEEYNPEDYGTEKTGLDCAKWLIDYCIDNKLKLPEFLVHSMNPVGRKAIKDLLENYKKYEESN